MYRSAFTRAAALAALALIAAPTAFAKKKSKAPPPPKVGFQQDEGWSMSCYYPPDWGSLKELDRRAARGKVLDDMMSQWAGKREDGVSFNANIVEDMETTLLGKMELVEAVSAQNLELCKAAATGGGTSAWESWLRGAPAKLTAGECFTHFDFTMYDYLEIAQGWQRAMPICRDDKIRISGTPKDKFRISDKGPWITVAGDPDQPTVGGDWPCNLEGCLAGILVLRFVGESGVESIVPIGDSREWRAPENGEITYRINDTTFFDNVWFKNGQIQDRTSIEITGVQ